MLLYRKLLQTLGLPLAFLLIPQMLRATPLRVFIRSGPKTHGPGQHDHPRFAAEWKELLNQRGLKAEAGTNFPSAEQLGETDVLIIHAANGASINGNNRTNFEAFLRNGGGLVVLHDGIVGNDPAWFKTIAGGAWENGHAKWHEGEVGEYFVDSEHPITRGVSNFDWNDEIYYELQMMPDAHVLATSFHSVFVIAPQIWTYEQTRPGGSKPCRAFVSIPGHQYVSFNTPHYRAILLRGIAWAGGRSNVDEFCLPLELASLKYPEGGPTAPEKAAAKLNVHPEFQASLVASEPLVEKVISIDWDPRGRLWVAETPEYPNGRTIHRNDLEIHPDRAQHPEAFQDEKENRPSHDRISWLEDSNGDGVMDQKHVFYDGLELVTSLVFYRDGVIVAQAPDILWLRDTDGDGKADKVEKLYTGFGINDAHAVLSNFRWGMDGWIYGTVGYSAGQPTSGDGSKDFGRVTAGVLRFRPDGSALEQVASGACNTWGLDFGPDGELFYVTATCGEHFLHVVMPEKALARGNIGSMRASSVLPDHQQVYPAIKYTRPPYMQIDWVGMFTASAGCCIYDGGAWPVRFNGTSFISEPTVNIVHNDFLRPKGTTYIAGKEPGRETTEFITGTDPWFRPIHTRVGPDGALYVVDFYNQAVVHNDPRGPAHGARNAATRPDRDHKFARIWRVQHKEAKALPAWKLDRADPTGLVRMLDHPNGWVRGTAQRLLRETAADPNSPAVQSLARVAQDTASSATARVGSLWTMAELGGISQSILANALASDDPVMLKNALQIISEHPKAARAGGSGAALEDLVFARFGHADPRVRLAALTTLAAVWPLCDDVAKAAVTAFPSLDDPWLESAVIGLASDNSPAPSAPEARGFALTGTTALLAAAFGMPDQEELRRLIGLLVRRLALKQDGTLAGQLVVWLAGQPAGTANQKQVALQQLTATLRPETVPAFDTPQLSADKLGAALKTLLTSGDAAVAGATLPLVARWEKSDASRAEVKPVITLLATSLADTKLPDETRAQVAVNLLGVRQLDDSILQSVSALLAPDVPLPIQRRVVQALGADGDATAGQVLLQTFPRANPELREAIFGEMIRRTEWTRSFIRMLADKQIPLNTLGPAFTHRLRTFPDAGVAEYAAQTLETLRGPEAKQKDKMLAALYPEVQKAGNVERGHQVFATNCIACHVFKNEGRALAPNLTGMGAHGPAELLVHIVDPNRLVEPNFLTQSIETRDGSSYDGIVERENARELLLRNATGDYTIQQADIQSRRAGTLSLMPEGFDQLGAENLRDLLAYICSDAQKFRFIDMRPAFTADSTQGIFTSRDNTAESLPFNAFGVVKVAEVPFEIVSPAKSLNGNNLVVLRSRNGNTRELPRRVEVTGLTLKARRLHFLGGVGGWAWPAGGEDQKGLPAALVTITYADDTNESWTLVNGIDIADYNGTTDVPGSTAAPGLAQRGQVRVLTRTVRTKSPISRITLESMNNQVAPVFVAITAELE